MKILLSIALAAPLAAVAQTEYSRATIIGTPAPVLVVPDYHLQVCNDRNDAARERKALLDRDKRYIDDEGRDIAAAKARIDDELRRLDTKDAAAVAAYNARSDELNRRVAAHNRHVEALNGASALFNADTSDLIAYCNRLYVARR